MKRDETLHRQQLFLFMIFFRVFHFMPYERKQENIKKISYITFGARRNTLRQH